MKLIEITKHLREWTITLLTISVLLQSIRIYNLSKRIDFLESSLGSLCTITGHLIDATMSNEDKEE